VCNVVQAVVPYLSATVSKDKAEKVALDTLSHFFKEMQEKTKVVEEEEEGEDLCNCEFSLAYGVSVLCLIICLRHSVLQLAAFRKTLFVAS
jgi:elongation factor 3